MCRPAGGNMLRLKKKQIRGNEKLGHESQKVGGKKETPTMKASVIPVTGVKKGTVPTL